MAINLSGIPLPSAIEEIDYATLKAEVQTCLQKILPVDFLESDACMLVVEALLYREMLLRARINQAIRACFLPTAAGSDLDNIAVFYGIDRLDGEGDTAFRQRILLSLERFSTAGSRGEYEYQTLSVDAAIKEVKVYDDPAQPGHVFVVYYAEVSIPADTPTAAIAATQIAAEEDLYQRILTHINGEKVRPLTDVVHLDPAAVRAGKINLQIELWNMSDEARAKNEIETIFRGYTPGIGEDFPLSKIHEQAHVNGVYRVTAIVPTADIVIQPNEIWRLDQIILSFQRAVI